jgi:hypothetical protein
MIINRKSIRIERGKMETQKKTWEKPQLIILARGTPEESVLLACKLVKSGSSQNNKDNGCGKSSCSDLCAANHNS